MKKIEAKNSLSDFLKVTNTFLWKTQEWISGSLESGLNFMIWLSGTSSTLKKN